MADASAGGVTCLIQLTIIIMIVRSAAQSNVQVQKLILSDTRSLLTIVYWDFNPNILLEKQVL